MSQQPVDGSLLSRAFGNEEDAPDMAFFADEEETPQEALAEVPGPAPTEGEDEWPEDAEFASEEEAAETPSEGEEPVPDGEQPPTEAGPQDGRWLGRYETPAQMENGFRQFQSWATQQQQQWASERQQLQAQLEEQKQLSDAMLGLMAQTMQETDPQTAATIQQTLAQRQAEEQIQRQIQQGVEQQVGPVRQQLAQQQVVEQANRTVAAFYANHPDVQPRGPEDNRVADILGGFMQQGLPVDVTNLEHLEAALAAARNPQFGAELMMTPQAWSTPGMINAAIARGAGNPTQPNQPPAGDAGTPGQRQPVRRRVDSQVESGSSGAPVPSAPGTKPRGPWGDDEFADAAVAYQKGSTTSSPIFGTRKG